MIRQIVTLRRTLHQFPPSLMLMVTFTYRWKNPDVLRICLMYTIIFALKSRNLQLLEFGKIFAFKIVRRTLFSSLISTHIDSYGNDLGRPLGVFNYFYFISVVVKELTMNMMYT